MTLGTVEKLDAHEARKRAKDVLSKVHLGGDPQTEKAETRAQASVTLGMVDATSRARSDAPQAAQPSGSRTPLAETLGAAVGPAHSQGHARATLRRNSDGSRKTAAPSPRTGRAPRCRRCSHGRLAKGLADATPVLERTRRRKKSRATAC